MNQAVAADPPPPGAPLRVLVVEDSEFAAELAIAELQSAGVLLVWRRVETEAAYLDALREFSPDLVLSDYGLPQFSGLEALRLAQEHAPDLPFVIFTGSTNEETAVACMRAGAWDYVLKDRLARLPSAVQGAIERARSRAEHRRVEAALAESERRYRTLFEQSPVPIWEEDFSQVQDHFAALRGAGVVDWQAHFAAHPEDVAECARRVRVVAVNQASLRAFGVEREEQLSGALGDHFDEDSYPVFRAELVGLAAGVTHQAFEIPVRDLRGQRRIMSLHLAVVPGHEATLDRLLVSFIDVTHEVALQAQLLQAQKMEAVGRLAGGIAHDFNNLLGVIHGHAEQALALAGVTPDLRCRLDEVLGAAQRAAGLTRQLLAFSRRQLLQPRLLDLNTVVADTMKMLRRLIGEDVQLVVALAPEPTPVRIDPGQIGQVLVNLALNARDAMPTGGVLTIATRLREAATGAGPQVELSVADTGVGMDDALLEHLFEPFFTTKPEGRGTGLGLSTAYGIVEQSGGRILVHSEPGRGSEFSVLLPLEQAVASVPSPVPAAVAGGSETILVVEDQGSLRELVVEMLEGAGYRVIAAANGREALEKAALESAPLHLVLTDVIMPLMSGRELVDRLLGRQPGVRALFTSGYTADVIERSGVSEGRVPLLGKPFTRAELLRAVRDALAVTR